MRQSAQAGSAQGVRDVVTSCQKNEPWTLYYKVKSVTHGRWPRENVRVQVRASGGSFTGGVANVPLGAQESRPVEINGNHPCELFLEATPATSEWQALGPKPAHMLADNGKTLELEIRKLFWVSFDVKERTADGSSRPLPSVTLEVTVPGQGKTSFTKRTDPTRLAGLQDGTASIDEARLGTDVWEVLDLTST